MNFEVRVISDDISYEDGSESDLTSILRAASDRSSWSDELVAAIHDWPSMYHLSPLRSHLFSPLKVGPGDRVLEIGCGMGANVRAMAERGAEVVGIEGSFARATAARIRTAEFEKVEILAGDVADYTTTELFDVVLVIGVLEYTSSGIASINLPGEFLGLCRNFMKSDSVLVLAIENQMGLKYLLSYPEDHLGQPWIGIEGYRKRTPRTWSRVSLSKMLSEAGLQFQEFLNPYPDYKLPSVLVRERLYQTDAGRELVKNFVRRPVADGAGNPLFVCDTQRAFAQMVDAGLGPHVANSFLVVASPTDVVANRLDDAEMWTVSRLRRRRFRHLRRIVADGDSHRLEGPPEGLVETPATRVEWLSNQGHSRSLVHRGVVLDDEMVEAIVDGNTSELTTCIFDYLKFLVDHCYVDGAARAELSSPFGPITEEQSLPGSFLDCVPQNLIRTSGGVLEFVDDEWKVAGGCSLNLIFARGLLVFANRVVESGLTPSLLPTGEGSVVDVVVELSRLAGLEIDNSLVDRLIVAEYEFQSLVAPEPFTTFQEFREGLVVVVTPQAPGAPLLRVFEERNLLRDDRKRILADLDAVAADRDAVAADRKRILADLDAVAADRVLVDEDRKRILADRERVMSIGVTLQTEFDQLTDTFQRLQCEMETLNASVSYRVGLTVTWPLRVCVSLLQRLRARD